MLNLQSKKKRTTLFSSFAKAEKKQVIPAECGTSSSNSTLTETCSESTNPSNEEKHEVVVSNDDDELAITNNLEMEVEVVHDGEPPATTTADDLPKVVKTYETPAQSKLEAEIKDLYEKIDNLENFKNTGFPTSQNIEELKSSREILREKKKRLKVKIDDAKRARESRKRKADVLKTVAAESASNAEKLSPFTHEKGGRPPMEDTYPDLHKVIVALATQQLVQIAEDVQIY